MYTPVDRAAIRRRIRYRIRKKIHGTAERPRLAVFRSHKHIYAQAIDDDHGRTLAHCSTLERVVRERASRTGTVEAAKVVGELMAERLKAKRIETVVFDRGGYRYHGRVKALAEAARAAGLKF